MLNLSKIKSLYDSNIEKYGVDSMSVGWNDKESQILRFDRLMHSLHLYDDLFSINELGCGYGELFKYLEYSGLKITRFDGYDISEAMVVAANEYISSDIAKFHTKGLIDHKRDFSVASGIFNVSLDIDKAQWKEHILRTIENMWEFSDKGIAFNMLTSYVDREDEGLFYGDPLYYFNFCKTKLSKYVTLTHDYPLWEWTIAVRKKL